MRTIANLNNYLIKNIIMQENTGDEELQQQQQQQQHQQNAIIDMSLDSNKHIILPKGDSLYTMSLKSQPPPQHSLYSPQQLQYQHPVQQQQQPPQNHFDTHHHLQNFNANGSFAQPCKKCSSDSYYLDMLKSEMAKKIELQGAKCKRKMFHSLFIS